MNRRTSLKLTIGVLAFACMLLGASPSQANITFHVDINTSQLVGNPNAPFAVDFQLNSGNTLNNNSAFINNFTFGGGGAPFGLANTVGGASGSLPLFISLTDSAAFNELFQSFTAGGTFGFDVSLTTNVDAGQTPDAFTFSFLDRTFSTIPTTGLGDALLLVNINNSMPTVQTFRGTGAFDRVTVSVSAVPDTGSTIVLLGIAALGLTAFSRKIASPQQS